MVWIDIKNDTHIYYKKYSIVVMFLLLFFCGKSVTLRDVLYCFLQDLLRITVIHFEKTPVVSNILERARTFLILIHFIVYDQRFCGAHLISVKIGERI